jgi:hypothetical protein
MNQIINDEEILQYGDDAAKSCNDALSCDEIVVVQLDEEPSSANDTVDDLSQKVELKPECIFLIGDNKNEQSASGLHMATARNIINQLDFSKIGRVTILNFREKYEYHKQEIGEDRCIFTKDKLAEKAMLEKGMQLNFDISKEEKYKQPGMNYLWDYLIRRYDDYDHKRVGQIALIHIITHSDYQGIYVKNGYEDSYTEYLYVNELMEEHYKKQKEIVEQLSINCYIKIWGCGKYNFNCDSYNQSAQKCSDELLVLNSEDAQKQLKGLRAKDEEKNFTRFFDKLKKQNTNDADKAKFVNQMALNVYNSFIKRKLPNYYSDWPIWTYYPVALSAFLERPVVATPWGVYTEKLTIAKPRLNKDCFRTLKANNWGKTYDAILSPYEDDYKRVEDIIEIFIDRGVVLMESAVFDTLSAEAFQPDAELLSERYLVYEYKKMPQEESMMEFLSMSERESYRKSWGEVIKINKIDKSDLLQRVE